MRKVVGADPLKVSPINPLDFRCVNGIWKYDPGWHKNIMAKTKSEELAELQQQKKKRK